MSRPEHPASLPIIKLAAPRVSDEALQAVRDVLTSGWLVQGERVAELEAATAEITGIEHAVAVSSGTAALHTALAALGIEPGDAVAVSAYSYVATANVVEMCGATPLFVDIEPDTFNMNPGELERVLSEPRESPIRAVIVVHAFGQMADLDAITQIAGDHDVPIIEDAACALGATWAGSSPGAHSAMACFSFHPRKAITTGEGGMVVTADRDTAVAARAFRNHGLDPDADGPDFTGVGLNYRMTEFQAAMGTVALRQLEAGISQRRLLAKRYDELLAGRVGIPHVAPQSGHVYQSYVVLLDADAAAARPQIIEALAQRGVESTIGTWAIPTTSFYRARYGYTEASFPVTSDVFARSLSLPLHEGIEADDQDRVVEALGEALDEL